jgi:hypothetical protein
MATPPKLPPDAFKQNNREPASPWDVQASAPAPVTQKPKLELPMWANRPLAAHDHAQQLDLDAAVNEFGLKMPREQAEDEAYRQYLYHPVKGQHALAAYHHLAGMKAAHAAGDMDAARKHSLMYNLHAKALGKSPVDAARELSAHIKDPAKVYKFKAHRGDAFAVNQPPPQADTGVISSTPPPLNKREREVLYMLYLMGSAALVKGEVVGEILGPTVKQPRKKHGNDIAEARSKKLGEPHYPDHDANKCGSFTCSACKRNMPSCRGGEGSKCDDCEVKKGEVVGHIPGATPPPQPDRKRYPKDEIRNHKWIKEGVRKPEAQKKAEMTPKKKSSTCRCNSYNFPHRHGGGKCVVVDPL